MGRVVVNEIRESHVNRTEGYRSGDSEYYEPLTNEVGALFRELQREHGRCTGRMYQDVRRGSLTVPYDYQPKVCGWVFEKREKYTDCNEWYLCETWVHVRWGYEFQN